MEQNIAVALMPSNRVAGFLNTLPQGTRSYIALLFGMKCRQEAVALIGEEKEVQKYLASFPEDSAIRYYFPKENEKGRAKISRFVFSCKENMLYEMWQECCKICNSFSPQQLRKLNFALFSNEDSKQIYFQSYSEIADDDWAQMMSEFNLNLESDKDGRWKMKVAVIASCDIKKNY